jgi:hypothetical protein
MNEQLSVPSLSDHSVLSSLGGWLRAPWPASSNRQPRPARAGAHRDRQPYHRRLPTGNRAFKIAFLAVLIGFITMLGIGVLGRWRWTFWLILIAFLAGVLRASVAIMQFAGILAADARLSRFP